MKIPSSLLLSLLLATTPAFAQINWDGGPGGAGTDLLTPANWVGDLVPTSTGFNSGRQDAQWDGSVAGALNLTFGAAFGGANGVGLFMTAAQTSAVTLTNSAVGQQDLRLFTTSAAFPTGVIEIANGAGALTIGAAGTANPIRLLLSAGTAGRNAIFNNNSINTATIEENVLIETGTTGAGSSGLIFNTGVWDVKGSLGVFGASGAGSLATKDGAFVTLSGDNTAFASLVNVDGGTLSFSAANNLGSGTTSVRLGQTTTSGTLEFTGATNVTISRLMRVGNGGAAGNTGSATINNNGAGVLTFDNAPFNEVGATAVGVNRSLTLGGSNTGNNTISGVIANNNPGLVSVIKADAGKWILSGTNTYTGATTVSAGTLLINGSTAVGSTVTVASGAVIGGDGTVNGNLTLNSGALFGFDTANTSFTLDLTGTLDLNNSFGVASLRNLNGTAIAWDTVALNTYTLINTSFMFDDTNIQNFGFGNRLTGLAGGREAYFQNGSLQLVVIPEPSSFPMLLGALGAAALIRRRRS